MWGCIDSQWWEHFWYSRAMRCPGLLVTLLHTQWSIVSALKWNLKPISQRWGLTDEVISAGELLSHTPSWSGNSSWILFPHCKSSQTSWSAAGVIKETMPVPSMSLHVIKMYLASGFIYSAAFIYCLEFIIFLLHKRSFFKLVLVTVSSTNIIEPLYRIQSLLKCI